MNDFNAPALGRSIRTAACAALVLAVACAPVDPPPESESPSAAAELTTVGDRLESESHALEEVAPGVYFATATGRVNLVSNAMIVVNDDHVLVVDSHITPDAGDGLVATVRGLTDKPIRYLVNSHYHFDHAHGNQSFPDDTQIIGHEYTRAKLLGDPLSESTYQVIGSVEYEESVIAALEERLDGASERETLEAQIAMMKRHVESLRDVEPTPPDVTLLNKLTLFRGGREIQLLHLGRGHTGGDVVTYLPAEGIVFTGDLFYAGAPYLGDGFADEFPKTLQKLKDLEPRIIVPGHGPLVTDLAQIDFAQNYLRRYWSQVSDAFAQGLSVDDAQQSVDMSEYQEYAAFQVTRPEVMRLEVARMYELLERTRGSSHESR